MGLLDGTFGITDPRDQEAARMAILAASLGMLSGRGRNFGEIAGNAGMQGMNAYALSREGQRRQAEMEMQNKLRQQQFDQGQMEMDAKKRALQQEEELRTLAPQFMRGAQSYAPTQAEDAAGFVGAAPVDIPARFDESGFGNALLARGNLTGLKFLPKPGEPFTLKPGETRFGANGLPMASLPPETKADALSNLGKLIREQGQYPQDSGTHKLYTQMIQREVENQTPDFQKKVNALVDVGIPYEVAVRRVTGFESQPQDVYTRTTNLRQEFNSLPQVKNYNEVQPVLQSAREAQNVDTAAADLNLIYAAAKIFDPGSVVRESETSMVVASGSPAQRFMGQWNYITGGGRLTKEARASLMNEVESRARGYESGYQAARGAYEPVAQRSGVDPRDVFIEPFAPGKKKDAQSSDDGGVPLPDGMSEEQKLNYLRMLEGQGIGATIRNGKIYIGGSPTTAQQAPRRAVPGEVVNGTDGRYRFKGGDPNDRKNWEKV